MGLVIFVYLEEDNLKNILSEIVQTLPNGIYDNFYGIKFEADKQISFFYNKYDVKEYKDIRLPDEYYCFSYYLDFSGIDPESEEETQLANQLLTFFWKKGIPAVAEGGDDENILQNNIFLMKLEQIDFKSLEGKEVTTSDYFYTLTERGWKFDREESDLFYMLSKTFWAKGMKVSLIFQDSGCIPPDGEEGVIERVDFFKFDTKKYKEKTIYTQFEERSKDKGFEFDNVEDYIAYFNEQYPFYIPHSDFNTDFYSKDFDLLEKIELENVPTAIQKEVWTDLCNCES